MGIVLLIDSHSIFKLESWDEGTLRNSKDYFWIEEDSSLEIKQYLDEINYYSQNSDILTPNSHCKKDCEKTKTYFDSLKVQKFMRSIGKPENWQH